MTTSTSSMNMQSPTQERSVYKFDGRIVSPSLCDSHQPEDISSPTLTEKQQSAFPRLRTMCIEWSALDAPAAPSDSDAAIYPTKPPTSKSLASHLQASRQWSDANSSTHTAATVSTQLSASLSERSSLAAGNSLHTLSSSWGSSLHSPSDSACLKRNQPGKFLRFSDDVITHHTFSRKSINEKQKRKLWYRPKEYKRIKQEGLALLHQYKQQDRAVSAVTTPTAAAAATVVDDNSDCTNTTNSDKVEAQNEPICVDGLLRNDNVHGLLHERHYHQKLANKLVVKQREEGNSLADEFGLFCDKSHKTLFVTSLLRNRQKIHRGDRYIN